MNGRNNWQLALRLRYLEEAGAFDPSPARLVEWTVRHWLLDPESRKWRAH